MKTEIDYVFGDFLPEAGSVTSVADGILWIRMPLPFALNHINLYLLDDGDGWVAIDCGIADDATRSLWNGLLETHLAGKPIKRVIATHFHPDHLGLARWLIDKSAADFWISDGEWQAALVGIVDDTPDSLDGIAQFYRRAGMNGEHVAFYREVGNDYCSMMDGLPADINGINENTVFQIGGHAWSVLIGAGHSPEHVSLYCRELNIVLGGDMLLPRITPIIAVWPGDPDANPLADYLAFIRDMDTKGIPSDVLVLPAHDRPYRGLDDRLQALDQHHEERLDRTLEACAQPATAQEIMGKLFTRELDMYQSRFAIGESIAHAHMLMHQGTIHRDSAPNDIFRFSRT